MNTKQLALAAAMALVLASTAPPATAQEGFRGWLKDKKEQIVDATAPKQAEQQQDAKDLPPVQVDGQRPAGPDHKQAVEKGLKGCGIGAIAGALLGVDPNAACAVGGLIGAGISYRQQLKQAREVEAAAHAAGLRAQVSTQQSVDQRGRKQEGLGSLVIAYEPADMKSMDAKTTAMFDKLAGLATKAKNQLTFRFEGADSLACQIPMMELQQRGALANHLVENACGSGENRMVVTPMPELE